MPISREEFETGAFDLRSFTLHFLRSNSEEFFAVRELMDEYASRGGTTSETEFLSVLNQLVSEDMVERVEIKGVTYYSYRRPSLGFRRR